MMINDLYHKIFLGFISIALICIFSAIILESYVILLAPFVLLFGYILIMDYKLIYLLLFICIPFSIEYYAPNGIGIDLPTELLMLILTGIGFIKFAQNANKISIDYIKHPISYVIILHVCWIFISSITSTNQLISFKFFLAKIWYVVPFYYLSLHLLNKNKDIYKLLKLVSISLTLAILFVMVKHYKLGLSFITINKAVYPIFRNHVNYASLIAVFTPFVWVLYQKTKNKIYVALMILSVIAVYFSYTRAAYVTVLLLPVIYYAIKFRFLKLGVWIGVISIPFIVFFFTKTNNYLNYAPEFEKTIMNYEFDDLLSATYKMEDLSTMERVYRWVAGGRMISDRPIMGFGPSTFYTNYKGYVVTDFQTYVSDNPEKSGIHNYYLMTVVEQGIIGFIIFLALIVITLLIGNRIYFQTKDKNDRQIIMGSILSLITILAILLINDLLEVDKIGPFFFLCLAFLTHYDLKIKKQINT